MEKKRSRSSSPQRGHKGRNALGIHKKKAYKYYMSYLEDEKFSQNAADKAFEIVWIDTLEEEDEDAFWETIRDEAKLIIEKFEN